MENDLKGILAKHVEDEYKQQTWLIEKEIDAFKSLITEIHDAKELNIAFRVEGVETSEFKEHKRHLDLLEKAGLVKGETRFTHRNEFKRYVLTPNGEQIAKQTIGKT